MVATGRIAFLLAAASAVTALVACGGAGTKTPVERGKKTFIDAGCGTCHTLEAAGTKGMVGPRLDGLRLSRARVVRFVRNGGADMPAFAATLSSEQIADVAAFVSSSSGG